MSDTKKKKKSTKKYKKPDTSKLIPIIAIIEVIVLIAVSTYAWYFFNVDRELSSGIITVNADSGLEIDFKDAQKNTYINIFDYVDQETFAFEPATSVDGRNIYFPTSGSFGSTDTSSMVFRDGTANDVNSKYINIDFELSNTTSKKMDVYLSNRSSFTINEGGTKVNGKALRLAFYNNDGSSGNVTSNIVSKIKKAAAAAIPEEEPEEEFEEEDDDEGTKYYYEEWKVYFNNLSNQTNWSTIKAYVWHYADDSTVSGWPGDSMIKVSGNLYYYTFKNRYELDGEGNKINYYYDRILFNNGNGGSNNQTIDLQLIDTAGGAYTPKNGYVFTPNGKSDNKFTCTDGELVTNTVYFLKPTDWNVTPRCATKQDAAVGSGETSYEMKKVTTGIYSFTFPATDNHIRIFGGSGQLSEDAMIDTTAEARDSKLYYFPSDGTSGEVFTVDYSESSIYFYNTLGWTQPYAYVNAFADSLGSYTYAIPMIALSGSLFYCSVPMPFLKDLVDASDATYTAGDSTVKNISGLDGNCKVFFADSNSVSTATDSNYLNRSCYADCYSEYVYRMLDETTTDPEGSQTRYKLDPENYSDEVHITDKSYAVISPGVSAGFQRAANPVNTIDYNTGAVESIIPSFASSFDDFIIGSDNPVFSLRPGETVNMSMIIWLEGTDSHCTGENYAGKNINLYLEFSTYLAGDKIEGTYTYRFIDQTEQHWTCNTITNDTTGVTVEPVMQLYDATLDRGYIMEPVVPTAYAGEDKVKVWECTAPQALITGSDDSAHNIQFRRVNPYDETEVWNRWEAGNPKPYTAYALNNRVVSFTAFADGSPDPTLYHDYIEDYNMPSSSCGGLWGAFDTEILTVYDGRKDRSIGTLNFGYTYTYEPGLTMTVEYKSSSYRNMAHDVYTAYSDPNGTWFTHFYSIVVPTTIYDNASNSYFRNYTGVNDKYAINSDLNKNIEIGSTWWAGTVDGSFFELNEEGTDAPDTANHKSRSADYHSYWGSDVLYVQTESTLSVSYSSAAGKCVMMCKFYDHTDETNTHYYSYLYDDSNYKGTFDLGFVAVVPCDQEYDSYKIQRYRTADTSESTGLTRVATLEEHITPDTDGGRVYNIITSDEDNDLRIRKLDWDYKIVYYNGSDWGNDYWWPHLRAIIGSSATEIDGEDTGKTQKHGHEIIQYKVRSDADGQFWAKYKSDQSRAYSIQMSLADGYMYYPKTPWTQDGSYYHFDLGGETDGLSQRDLFGNGDNNPSPDMYISSSHFDNHYVNNSSNSGWPEYTPPSVKE